MSWQLSLPEWATYNPDSKTVEVLTTGQAFRVLDYIPESADNDYDVVITDRTQSLEMSKMAKAFRKAL